MQIGDVNCHRETLMNMLHARFGLLALSLTFPGLVFAQFPNYPEPNLPTMGSCVNETPLPLPERWQATTLMSPYLYSGDPNNLNDLSSRAELQVGRLVYDGRNRLMRATRYGVKNGGVIDLLISDKKTWVLSGSYEHPRCVATLAKPYKVPGRVWQDQRFDPVCVGNHATAPTINSGPKVDWWKQKSPITSPGAEGQAADWYWFDAKGHPTRTMFWYKHEGLPAILGDYAFTNFYEFERGNDIDLREIRSACEDNRGPRDEWNEEQLLDHQAKAAQGQANPAGKLIPGLSYGACSRLNAQPPHWPAEIYMTSFSTAAKYSTPEPLVTSVYYQPKVPALRTRLHDDGTNGPFWSDALLIDQDSYGVDTSETAPYAQLSCGQGPHTSLPGAPHVYWGQAGYCECMGVIERNPYSAPIAIPRSSAVPCL